MKHTSWVFVSFAALVVSGAISGNVVSAQGNATISGIVQDQSKALIPGVSVVITNANTGIKSTTITNEAGAYAFPSWSISIIERNTTGLPRDPFGSQMGFRGGGGDRPYPRPDIVGPWVTPKMNPTWVGDNGWMYGGPGMFTNFRDPQCINDVANGIIPSNPDSGTGAGQFNFATSCTLSGLAFIAPQGTPGSYPVLDASGNPTGQYAVNVLQNSKPGTQGNVGHSQLQLPRRQTLDANLSKSFQLSESKTLQVRIDATNVLNHPNWNEPSLSIQNSNFGRTTGKGGPGNRVVQGQLRVTF